MSYDLAKELAMNLDVVKKHHITNGLVINTLANFIHKYDVHDLRLLNELAESLLSINENKPEKKSLDLTPESLLQADIMEKGIKPWVEDVREQAFGSKDIPFSSRDSMMDWLKQYTKTQEQLFEKINEMMRTKLQPGMNVGYAWDEFGGIYILPDTPPGLILSKTCDIAGRTGIEKNSLFMHVLTNSKIICPRFEIKYSVTKSQLPVSGLQTKSETISISFNHKLSPEDIRQIFKKLSKDLGYRKSKPITSKHLELYRLVNEKEIPTGRGKVAFWQDITKEWNKRHTKDTYASWKGPRLAYKRLIKLLSEHELSRSLEDNQKKESKQ